MCVNCNNNACGGCQPVIPQGLPGVNGKNAYTFTTTSFTMPAVSSSVTLTVQSTGQFSNQWAIAGQIVYIAGAGYFTVVSKTGNNQITVTNLGYTGNATPGVTIASNAGVSPSGIIGATGAAGAAGVNGTTNLYSNSSTTSTAVLNSWTTLRSYTLPGNTINTYTSSLADALQITLALNHTINTSNFLLIAQDRFRISFGGNNYGSFLIAQGNALATLRITADTSSGARGVYSLSGASSIQTLNNATVIGGTTAASSSFSGINFANPITINVDVNQTNASSVEVLGLYIDKIEA